VDISKNMLCKTLDIFQDIGKKKKILLGYEAFNMQANIFTALSDNNPEISWKDITGELAAMRAIKTNYEIEMIRKSAHIADMGQDKIRELVLPGKSEIAIYSEARAYMEVVAGKRIREAGDFVSGERCGTGGEGRPLDVILKEGDLLISDIIPRVDGWFADCTCTTSAGKASVFNKKIYKIVMDALEIGAESAKPGMLACELDFLVRGYIEKHGYRYEHHTGHGVGICQSESPWIVPYNKEVLKEGMIITLEPAIYAGNKSGVRIEGLFLMTKDGLEPLLKFKRQLET
jgi:Xaa-Pro dipeptidase